MLWMAIPQFTQQCTNRPETVAGEVLLLLLLAWCPALPNFMYLHHVGIYVNKLNFPDD